MERFVIIVNGWKPLTMITKRSILDVAAALDPPLRKPFLQNTSGQLLLTLIVEQKIQISPDVLDI